MGAEAVAKLLPQGGQGILMAGPPKSKLGAPPDFSKASRSTRISKCSRWSAPTTMPPTASPSSRNAAQANPKFDFVLTSRCNSAIDFSGKYSKAIYVAGSLQPVTLEALKDGGAAECCRGFSDLGRLHSDLADGQEAERRFHRAVQLRPTAPCSRPMPVTGPGLKATSCRPTGTGKKIAEHDCCRRARLVAAAASFASIHQRQRTVVFMTAPVNPADVLRCACRASPSAFRA